MATYINLITKNWLILLLIILALFIFLSATNIFKPKVTLKKRKEINHKINSSKMIILFERIPFIRTYRDELVKNMGLITRKNATTNIAIANNYIKNITLVIIVISTVSDIFAKYMLLKIIIPIICLIVILFFIDRVLEKKNIKCKGDFPELVSVFTSHYAITQSVLSGFENSMEDAPKTYKYELNLLINNMLDGEQYENALNNFAKRIDYEPCYEFIEILKTNYIKKDNVLPALIDLKEALIMDSNNELNASNELSNKVGDIIIGFMGMIGSVYINCYLLGTTYTFNFLFNTNVGIKITIFAVTSVIIIFNVLIICKKLL